LRTRVAFFDANVSKKSDFSNEDKRYFLRKLQGALKSWKFSILENLTRLFKNLLFSFSAFWTTEDRLFAA